MKPDNIGQLKDALQSYHADLESPQVRVQLVDACLPRLLATLEMIPESTRGGDFLELGASPFFLTLCLRRLCQGRITLANWFGTKDTHGSQRLTHARTGETLILDYDLFNVETELFPYADESFDVVIFSELIEHLGLNPVRTMSEIHRVLRPGGYMVLTTPNSISLNRLETLLRGGSQMVDRYSPLLGAGARHNREYHPSELRDLLDDNGFVIEELAARDLRVALGGERLRRAWRKLFLESERLLDVRVRMRLMKPRVDGDLADGRPGVWQRLRHRTQAYWEQVQTAAKKLPREEHIFLRARRVGPFRWHFHRGLFVGTELYVFVRHPWMEMNRNDSIQCGEGWGPLEEREAKAVRRIRGVSQGFLRIPTGQLTFHLSLFVPDGGDSLRAHLIVWDRWLGRQQPEHVYADAIVPLERGRWQQIDLHLQHQRPFGNEAEIRIAINGDARANPPVAEPKEDEHCVAVDRFWFTASEADGP